MGNQFVTPVVVHDKMLEYFDNILTAANNCNRKFESVFTMSKESFGQTFYVKKPARYQSQTGPIITTAQDVNIGKVPVVMNKWRTVLIKLPGLDKTFNAKQFDQWADENLKPVVSPLANDVDKDVLGVWPQIYNFIGTPGTGPTTADVMAAAREKMTYFATPLEDRKMYFSPTGQRKTASFLTTLYNPMGAISEYFKTGATPPMFAYKDVYEAQNIGALTVGAYSGTPLVNGANQVGSSLVTDGWGNSITGLLNIGDVFTVAGVYSVNPITKVSTGILQDFVVTVVANSGASTGPATLSIQPPIITSGAFQTVSASPADNAAITVKTGTASSQYQQQIGFWKDAIGLVTVPIAPLRNAVSQTRSYKGLSITMSQDSDIWNFEDVWRVDIAYGVVCFYPENCIRVTN